MAGLSREVRGNKRGSERSGSSFKRHTSSRSYDERESAEWINPSVFKRGSISFISALGFFSKLFLQDFILSLIMNDARTTLNQASSLVPPSKTHSYRIASIPADGIGPEVVSAAIEVVQTLAKTLKTFTVEFTHIPWGTAYYKQHGRYVDENVLDVLRRYDAALFGSVGAPGSSILHVSFLCGFKDLQS